MGELLICEGAVLMPKLGVETGDLVGASATNTTSSEPLPYLLAD